MLPNLPLTVAHDIAKHVYESDSRVKNVTCEYRQEGTAFDLTVWLHRELTEDEQFEVDLPGRWRVVEEIGWAGSLDSFVFELAWQMPHGEEDGLSDVEATTDNGGPYGIATFGQPVAE